MQQEESRAPSVDFYWTTLHYIPEDVEHLNSDQQILLV
jgi:hypothetical protein